MKSGGQPAGMPRREKHFQEDRKDPYMARVKLQDPTLCPSCGVVFSAGRWHWAEHPEGAAQHVCPACQRIKDKVPAGIVHLRGGYFEAHRDELLQLARNQESKEKPDHPLNRIMAIVKRPDEVEITTTDVHLPRRIGETLQRAHKGELSLDYAPSEYFVRVNWSREI